MTPVRASLKAQRDYRALERSSGAPEFFVGFHGDAPDETNTFTTPRKAMAAHRIAWAELNRWLEWVQA